MCGYYCGKDFWESTGNVADTMACYFLCRFVEIHVSAIEHPHSAWSRVVTSEIPVAEMVGAGFVQFVNRLEDNLYLSADVGRSQQLGNLCAYLFVREWRIDFLYMIYRRVARFDFLIYLVEYLAHATLFQ